METSSLCSKRELLISALLGVKFFMYLVKSLFLCLHEIIYNLFGYNFRVLEKKEEEGRHEKEYVSSITFNWFSQMPLYDCWGLHGNTSLAYE